MVESNATNENLSLSLTSDASERTAPLAQKLKKNARLLPANRIHIHHPKAGLNPIADAAGYLFQLLGNIKQLEEAPDLTKLQKELIEEITLFQETVKNHAYPSELVLVCRYVLCATFDDVIGNAAWASQGEWTTYSLLTAFNQDTQHHAKFFAILERALQEQSLYIDLMELMYLCLNIGYKGHYRATEHSQYQIEQITNNLYKHIRAYRGNISKTLSPMPLKKFKTATPSRPHSLSPLFIFFLTTCIIMGIFISLGYLMDVFTNDAYKIIATTESPSTSEIA